MPWNPDLYHKFQSERQAPFYDLLSLVTIRENLRVVDLGCGTGELTAQLAEALPGSEVLGVDNSPQMLERAQAYARPGLRFELAGIEDVSGEWDLIFSNAAIHWVDDHATLIPRLMGMLRPRGQIAVQVPSNHGHPALSIVRELAAEEPFRTALGGFVRHSPVLSINEYAELLYAHGGSNLTVYEKVYPQVLEDSDAMATFTAGTVLVPYMERLPEGLGEEFKRVYRERLSELYPGSPVFYGFRRTLFAATRP
jgi:trans-aconitate 2-methyltransferase